MTPQLASIVQCPRCRALPQVFLTGLKPEVETADVARTLTTLTAVQTTAVQTTCHPTIDASKPRSALHHQSRTIEKHLRLHTCSPHHVQGMSPQRENLGKNQWRTRGGGEDLCLSIDYLGISKGPNLSSNSTRLPLKLDLTLANRMTFPGRAYVASATSTQFVAD